MLSRVADSLYWMSRYIERAENIARILDVNMNLLLDLPNVKPEQVCRYWQALITTNGDDEEFSTRHKQADAMNVTNFLTFDAQNANSIVSSIRSARENARTVREQISSEMWEQLNRLYLFVRDHQTRDVLREGSHGFYQAIKEGSQTFQGITDATMTHGEGWEFIRGGKFLERADKTTRILDVKYFLLNASAAEGNGSVDAVEWMSVLKSCSALEAYRKLYSAAVQPQTVVEFLLLDDVFPRSVKFSIAQIAEALFNVTPVRRSRFANDAQKLAGRLRAQMEYSSVDDAFQHGLHQYLDDLQVRFNAIGEAIHRSYIALPADPAAEADSPSKKRAVWRS